MSEDKDFFTMKDEKLEGDGKNQNYHMLKFYEWSLKVFQRCQPGRNVESSNDSVVLVRELRLILMWMWQKAEKNLVTNPRKKLVGNVFTQTATRNTQESRKWNLHLTHQVSATDTRTWTEIKLPQT